MFHRTVAFLLVACGSDAQTLVESPAATLPGRVGVEAGITVAFGDAVDVSGPEGLVLVGLGRGVEFRLALPDVVGLDVRRDPVRGLGDAAVGLKAEVGGVGGWRVAALAEVSVPTGSEAVGSGVASPLVLIVAGRDLGGVQVGVQAEGAWDRALRRVDGAAVALVSAGRGRLGAFAEAEAASSPEGVAVVAHGGVAVAVLPSQIDARAGTGLTDAAPPPFVGVGLRASL